MRAEDKQLWYNFLWPKCLIEFQKTKDVLSQNSLPNLLLIFCTMVMRHYPENFQYVTQSYYAFSSCIVREGNYYANFEILSYQFTFVRWNHSHKKRKCFPFLMTMLKLRTWCNLKMKVAANKLWKIV